MFEFHDPLTNVFEFNVAAPFMVAEFIVAVPVTPNVPPTLAFDDAANVVTDVAVALNVASVDAPDAANVVTDVASAANV